MRTGEDNMETEGIKKVIGIVSYFPDNINDRKKRITRFKKLLEQIGMFFSEIPIIIIAQNWNGYNPICNKNELIVYNYKRLGILNARKELRKKFLESEYDYLIMFDDDCIIEEKILLKIQQKEKNFEKIFKYFKKMSSFLWDRR